MVHILHIFLHPIYLKVGVSKECQCLRLQMYLWVSVDWWLSKGTYPLDSQSSGVLIQVEPELRENLGHGSYVSEPQEWEAEWEKTVIQTKVWTGLLVLLARLALQNENKCSTFLKSKAMCNFSVPLSAFKEASYVKRMILRPQLRWSDCQSERHWINSSAGHCQLCSTEVPWYLCFHPSLLSA